MTGVWGAVILREVFNVMGRSQGCYMTCFQVWGKSVRGGGGGGGFEHIPIVARAVHLVETAAPKLCKIDETGSGGYIGGGGAWVCDMLGKHRVGGGSNTHAKRWTKLAQEWEGL